MATDEKRFFFDFPRLYLFHTRFFSTNRLNLHIIRGEHFESNVEEAVISSIHKD